MARVVELPSDRIVWPERCCCCAGKEFHWRRHTEKVVVWTVLSITRYREVTLEIPVCKACAGRSTMWFAAAAVAAGLGYALVALPEHAGSFASSMTLVLWIGAIAAALVGVRSRPLKILGYDADKETLRMQVRDERISGALMRQVGGKVSAK